MIKRITFTLLIHLVGRKDVHHFVSIPDLITDVTSTLQKHLGDIGNKRTLMNQVEKRAWRKVDDVETHATVLKDAIDRVIEEKVSEDFIVKIRKLQIAMLGLC